MQIVPATADHVAALARLRVALLEETGAALDAAERAALLRDNEAFYAGRLAAPDWRSWVALFEGEVGAVGTMALWPRPPYPGNPAGLDAYLLNMYTAPARRGRGAATAILGAALDWARGQGARKVVLHATDDGRRLYARHGFVASAQYMELAWPAPA
ncbi:MAG: GNAT family N-acetyltransferase [Rubrivivax sp.]|nr:GNAT family N-acetyltransferase [Rubrivivax sp.]